MSWLSQRQIKSMGFASVGSDVYISHRASFYNCPSIHIGSNVRIDDFCVLSAGQCGITIGSFIHIAAYCSLIGAGHIVLGDFCNLSSRVSIYSSNDDYSGKALTNPMIPSEYTNVDHRDVILEKHVIVGSGSVILPGVSLGTGVAIGALSLVRKNCQPFSVYAGIPARKIGRRRTDLLEKERRFRASRSETPAIAH